MKIYKILIALFAASLMLSQSANAGNSGSKGYINGKPFSELNEKIEANSEAVLVNSDAISANLVSISNIESSVAELQLNLISLTSDVTDLTAMVDENTGAIDELVASDSALQAAITSNENLLYDLRVRHNEDVANLSDRIDEVSVSIALLQQSFNLQLLQVNQAVQELQLSQAGIDAAQDAEIALLQNKALSLMASVMTINATLSSHSSDLTNLTSRLNNVDSQINDLGARLASLESRVDTLECLPDHPEFPCEVKITVAGEAYGHHGACSGWNQCQDAGTCALWACEVNGYSDVSRWGDDKPCTEFNNCHLFYSRGSIDRDWGNWCGVRGVTDIYCKQN